MESRVFHTHKVHCTIGMLRPEGVRRTLCGIDVHADEAPHPYVDPLLFTCKRCARIVYNSQPHD